MKSKMKLLPGGNNIRSITTPNGTVRYEARWRDETGKQHAESFATPEAALKSQKERKLRKNQERVSSEYTRLSVRHDVKRATVLDDVYEVGDVLWIQRVHLHAAIKTGLRWDITGVFNSVTWKGLLEFIGSSEVWLATEWERV